MNERHVMPTGSEHVAVAACWCRPAGERIEGPLGPVGIIWTHREVNAMPYSIRKGKKGYAIVNKRTGKVVGHSSSKTKAQRSINARNAGAHGWHGSR